MPGRRGMISPGWGRKFRGSGYRMTAPRQAIMHVLSSTDKHLSAEDIYIKVHKTYPNVGLTTVYRTLELLTQMGMVLKFDF
ncbi:MAG: transcriptional repressor, partial [Candidatus Omnitrophota bacterium]